MTQFAEISTLQWRHNGLDSVSNHQHHDCLLKRLSRRRSKKTSKLCVTGLCVGIRRRPVNSPHKGPVMRKMFPIDDVIMKCSRKTRTSVAHNGDMTSCLRMTWCHASPGMVFAKILSNTMPDEAWHRGHPNWRRILCLFYVDHPNITLRNFEIYFL